MEIVYPESTRDFDAIRKLFREYEEFLDVDLQFQSFESELATLPGKYAPPCGVLLLAKEKEAALGCGAIRRFGPAENRICEMKRLYVRPSARHRGIGKQLAMHLIQDGIRLGYRTMILDTLKRLEAATSLYRLLGFVPTEPYYENPLTDVLYWKLDLKGKKNR